MDAIYFVSPMSHIVDCILADMDRRRYQKSFLVWTGLLDPELRRRLYSHPDVRNQIQDYEVLNIDFFPRESHLVTFRDPWSFPVLYHPSCNHLIREHMQSLAQKVTPFPFCPFEPLLVATNARLRSQASVSLWASTLKYDTTDL